MKLLANLWKLYLIRFFKLNLQNSLNLIFMNVLKNVLIIEMIVQGVSTRNIKKVTEELCGESFSKSAVSEICKELDVPVKHFKERLLRF